ncbi:hypothetical protein Tco_0441538 [Tanacetum coccineum]
MHQPWRTFAALINRSLSGKTSGLDKLHLSRAQIIWGMYFQKNVDYLELLWEDFTYQIDNKEFKKQEKIYYLRFTKVIIHHFFIQEKLLSWRNRIRMHTSKDDYLINTLRFVSRKEASQMYGAVLPECLTSQEIKESKAYKTYLGYATGGVLSKVARKFKKASPSKNESELAPGDKEPVKRKPPSVEKITLTVTSDGAGDKPGVLNVTNDDSCESESESWGNDEDYNNNEQESSDESSEGNDAEMSEAQQGNENLETTQEQVVEDAHVTISNVLKKTKVPVTSSSRSSDLASKFLNFSDIPQTDAEIVSPLDVHVHHEVPRTQVPHSPYNTKVVDLKKDPLHTQVTSLVDSHLDIRLGETKQEFMNFLSESLTARIKEQVKDQLAQILPQEVSNFTPPVIKKLIKESRDEVTLAKSSSQPQSTYEATSTLTEFELKKILLDKMEKNESYLTAPKHRDCYDGLKKSYALDKDFFYSYDVYSLKRGRKDKDKDEDPSAGLDRELKKRKLSKDAEPTTKPKKKDSMFGSSKGTKSQPKSTGKSVQSEEPVFEVADSDVPNNQEGNLVDNEDEPRKETTSTHDWFKKPTPPQEPTDPDWNVSKTTQEGPTQNWFMNLAALTSSIKLLKDFDELMRTSIDFSGYILNGLKVENLTQEVLLGPTFRLLKGTRSNYAELEYDFEECYKALSEKLDWENPEGGISTMTYTTSTTKTKAAQYLPGIEDMVPNIWSPVKVAYDKYALWGISHWREQRKSFYAFIRGLKSKGDVYSTKRILAVTPISVIRKYGYMYLEEIVVRRADNDLYRFKEGDFPRLQINDIEDMLILMV